MCERILFAFLGFNSFGIKTDSDKIFLMKKNKLFFVIFVLTFLLFTTPVLADTTVKIGDNYSYQTLNEALNALPKNAGVVTFQLMNDLNSSVDAVISVPDNKGITELKIVCGKSEGIIKAGNILQLFANGISFMLGPSVEMDNAWIFGGAQADSKRIRKVQNTKLTINGSVAYVFGGGGAFSGGTSTVAETAEVELGDGGKIYWEIFGGGFAQGEASHSEVTDTKLDIYGETDYALAGGLAQDGGTATVRNSSSLSIMDSGKVNIALFGGGSAVGKGSIYETQDSFVNIHGNVAWAFGGDFVYQGGTSYLSGTANVFIDQNGKAKAVYGGSFATDPGSRAEVNQTKVEVKGVAETMTECGEHSKDGISIVRSKIDCTVNPVP